jgi:hypothetical protein
VRGLYIRCLTATIGLSSSLGCGSAAPATEASSESAGAAPSVARAGFLDLAPRKVHLSGREVSLEATSKIFYNFRPAQESAATRPTIVLFNGFAADVVRAFGTGPYSLQADGSVGENPESLTRFANLLYLDPRQAGFSYDVLAGRALNAANDCSQDVFSEYVDAADVLLAALQFMNEHSELKGPVYWLGESYAGVRISWIIAYLRQAWSLAPYQDESLQRALDQVDRDRYLSGQILLQPWLAGAAHASAIRTACRSPSLLAAVQQSVAAPCTVQDACDCAQDNLRSPYDYAVTVEAQKARFFAADSAQVSPAHAEALYGVPFEKIPGLGGAERARGFKCSIADDETPDQSALASLLGELPNGQSYNLAYSPLMPGKGPLNPDWQTQNWIGAAFLANAQQVPTFITDGKRDLVVPESALSPALGAVAGAVTISETPSEMILGFATGARVISIRHYASSGHMITMNEPHALAVDLSAWLTDHSL